MSSYHDTLAAISRLKSGEVALSAEQYLELLEAIEKAVQALLLAPSGTDPVATGLWYRHERAPALAQLADALAPGERIMTGPAQPAEQLSDREVLRELHEALLKNVR